MKHLSSLYSTRDIKRGPSRCGNDDNDDILVEHEAGRLRFVFRHFWFAAVVGGFMLSESSGQGVGKGVLPSPPR